MRRVVRRLFVAGGLFLLGALCTALLAAEYLRVHGATIVVTNINDSGPGSLRQALADAQDGDAVEFDPALNGQVIVLTSNELAIDKNITINDSGQTLLAVSRSATAGNFRIFHILAGHTVIIKNLTISGGDTFEGGAGILNDHSTLTLDSCTVRNNLSFQSNGGGIVNDGSGGNASLTILNSTVTNNSVFNGTAGGGICNINFNLGSVTLTIVNSTVTWNTAEYAGTLPPNAGGDGGGIYIGASNGDSGTLTITSSSITHNRAGPPNDYQLDYRGGYGGGIANHGALTTITNSAISDNEAGFGGGGIDNSGTLTITNSTISGNRGISMHDGIYFGYGGAISNSGPLTINNTTLSYNAAGQAGGALYGVGFIITNSTISGNGSGEGGALYGSGTITNSTISGNGASPKGNGGGISATGLIEIGNTILKTGPSGANIFSNGNKVISHGYNLSDDNGGGVLTGPGDQINTDPLLGPLQDNGGPTFTHELLKGSPAINAGDPNFTPPPFTDQRGYPRVFNGRIDVGSLEVQPVPTPTPSPTAAAQALNLSTRMLVQTGDDVGIGGFIITGSGKQVTVRGLGPSLVGFGVPNPLADPVLELHGPPGFLTIMNDNWRDSQTQCLETPELRPTNDLESAICGVTLDPGAYTAILRGKNNDTGIGLVEVYDVYPAAPSKLANISTRAFVSTGNDIMIAGFILGRNAGDDDVLIRGIGPSLASFGVPNALPNPQLELRDSSGTLIRYNNDWMDDPNDFFCRQMQPPGPPTNSLESCIGATLAPGQYTALLSGVNNGTGVGLVEMYDLSANEPFPTPTPGGTPSPSPTPSPSASPSPSAGPCVENWDSVTAPALPLGWVASNPDPGDGTMWVTSTSSPDTPPNSAFVPDQDGISDKVLDRPGVNVTSASATLSFRNNFDFEFSDGICWDWYRLEVSAPNISGGDFLNITDSQVGGSFVTGGYNCQPGGTAHGPIIKNMVWAGTSNGYIDTVINLGPNLAGQTVTFRFRMVTDEAVAAPGVHIDNIVFTDATCP